MYHNSQRTDPKFKPKWPRLKFLERKRQIDRLADLKAWADSDFVIHFKSSPKET